MRTLILAALAVLFAGHADAQTVFCTHTAYSSFCNGTGGHNAFGSALMGPGTALIELQANRERMELEEKRLRLENQILEERLRAMRGPTPCKPANDPNGSVIC